jgi:hypothetical protein
MIQEGSRDGHVAYQTLLLQKSTKTRFTNQDKIIACSYKASWLQTVKPQSRSEADFCRHGPLTGRDFALSVNS